MYFKNQLFDVSTAEALRDKERDIKNMEKHFQEERNKLQASITEVKQKLTENEQKMIKSVNDAKKEGEKKVSSLLNTL